METQVGDEGGTTRSRSTPLQVQLAAKLGRAVYLMLSKERVFDSKRFLART